MFYDFSTSNVPDIKTLIKVIGMHEGFRSKKYKDTVGIWTIGYGFNLESGTFPKADVERWTKEGITQEEADAILEKHIRSIISSLRKTQPWVFNLSPARLIAVIDLTFNMGLGWFNTFSNTITLLKSERYLSAGKALLNSRYAKQVKGRAIENAYAIVNNKYPVPFTEKNLIF